MNSHPRIGVPFESHLYVKFLPRVHRYGDLSVGANRRALLRDMLSVLRGWSPRPDLERALERMQAPTLHGAVDAILADWCAQQGKPRWGEKTPQHAFYWQDLMAGFPVAQVIHLVRDGRDVAASWKQARFGPKHLYVAAERWREYLLLMAKVRRALPASQFFELKYEELVLSPEKTVGALCEYLGEPYAPEMLSFYKDRTPYRTDERNLENLTRPLMQDNIEKWRRSMAAHDVLIVEAAAKAQLERAGYGVTNVDPRVSPVKRGLYRLVHPLLRLVAMAKNTQGQADAVKDLWALSKNRLVSLRR